MALAGVVGGVVTLSDFRRTSQIASQKLFAAKTEYSGEPEYSAGGTHYIFPADFATIYDLNPLYSAGTTGSGAAIAVAGRSNINLSDVETLPFHRGSRCEHAVGDCRRNQSGISSAAIRSESTLDVEWSGAVAPRCHGEPGGRGFHGNDGRRRSRVARTS